MLKIINKTMDKRFVLMLVVSFGGGEGEIEFHGRTTGSTTALILLQCGTVLKCRTVHLRQVFLLS